MSCILTDDILGILEIGSLSRILHNREDRCHVARRSHRQPLEKGVLPARYDASCRKLHSEPGLWFQGDTPTPEIGARKVLVAVTHAGICGTDRHIYEWDAWSRSRVAVGITTGHEFVGRVVAVGPAVDRRVGQRVSAEGHIGCGVCQPCRTGNGHICEKVDILGIDCNGCFAEFIAVPEENIWPVHPDIPNHIAAIFDPLGNAMHTVMAAGVSGRSVLITGVGIIGLMAVTIARVRRERGRFWPSIAMPSGSSWRKN